MRTEKVLIILPTFKPNVEFLRFQVQSILNQTYQDWHTLVLPDHEDDAGVYENIKELGDDRFEVVPFQIRKGFLKNFETGLQIAKKRDSHFIAFCDQDDIWESNKLELQINFLVESKSDVNHCDLVLINERGETLSESVWKREKRPIGLYNPQQLLVRNVANGCAMVFSKKLLDYSIPFPDIDGLYHDHWIMLVAAYREMKITEIDLPLVRYRVHTTNVIGSSNLSFLDLLKKFTHLSRAKSSATREYLFLNSIDTELKIRIGENKIMRKWVESLQDLKVPLWRKVQLKLGKFLCW